MNSYQQTMLSLTLLVFSTVLAAPMQPIQSVASLGRSMSGHSFVPEIPQVLEGTARVIQRSSRIERPGTTVGLPEGFIPRNAPVPGREVVAGTGLLQRSKRIGATEAHGNLIDEVVARNPSNPANLASGLE